MFNSRATRIALAAGAAAVLAVGVTGGVIAATTAGSGAFAMTDFLIPAVGTGGKVSQPVAGLWFGSKPSDFTKVGGDDWLTVSDTGLVTGTAPATAPSDPGVITVEAANGRTKSRVTIEVPVTPAGAPRRLEVASWNLDDGGANASWSAEQKAVKAIVANNIEVLGLQEADGAATALAHDLGWHSYQSDGDLGIVSAYPISDVTEPTVAVPAAGVTLDVDGQPVRVWTTHLDESDYGPDRACFDGATDLAAHEQDTTRFAQAGAVAAAMQADIAASDSAPVILLGDLASPSGTDWTGSTSGAHCDAGAVDWPAPDVFTSAGLTDSFRQVNPDPAADPGNTWSPTVTQHESPAGPEPQDRIDYVDFAGALQTLGSEALYRGWADADGDVATDWPSDHAAAVTLFELPLAPPAGASTPTSTSSPAATAPPAGSTAFAATSPRITGHPRVGARLRVVTGAWAPAPTFRYRWFANGARIRGAHKATYRIKKANRGKRITVKVTAARTGYATTTVASTATRKVKK